MMENISAIKLRKLVYMNNKGQKVLDLRNKFLRTIPKAVLQVSDVDVLNLSHNELTELPTWIDQLKNVTDLRLSKNNLSVLPKSIGNLEKLTMLDVSWNQLTELPTSITRLKQLEELDLYYNKLTVLHESIGNLENLTILDVSWNQLTALPTSITRLKQLEQLDLYHNHLTELPKSIGNMEKLTALNVSRNQLTALPTSITRLKQLEELYLDHNKLTVLPESIGNMEKLTNLNVGSNQLTALPTSITQLKKLEELYLYGNKLSVLPESIGNLKKLIMLDVSNNQLTALPTSITRLKKLQELSYLGDQHEDLSEVSVFQAQKELLEKRKSKTIIFRDKVKDEGDLWDLKEAAAFITFSPKAVAEPMEITCSLWSPRTCSPPLDENEALVSNVIELSHDRPPNLEFSGDFNGQSTVALSHSATDLKGYELVIKELTDPESNEWKDLETKNMWNKSDIQGDPLIRTVISGLLFPLAEAKLTQCSSFAVIWRLKSFTFSSTTTSLTDPEFTCIVPEYPDVSVSIPRSDLPESGDFSLTIKVQEVPCDEVKDDGVLVGPILHISSSPDVQFFKEPVTIKIPFSLREAKKEVLDLTSGQLKIFNCGAKYPEWTDITDELETPAYVKDGVVTFQVKHFCKFRFCFLRRKRKISSSESQHVLNKSKMRLKTGFSACLSETSPSGILMLTLYCYPRHMHRLVDKTISSIPKVLGHVQKKGREKMCEGDKAFVSVMEQIKPLKDKDSENVFLEFNDLEVFDRDMLVRVEGEGVPYVELVMRQEDQQEGKLICELLFSQLKIPQSSQRLPSRVDTYKDFEIFRLQSCSYTPPRTETCSSTSASLEIQEQSDISYPSNRTLRVTLLAYEWGSSKGGLSVINRELAMHLAKNRNVEVTLLLPHFTEKDKHEAHQHDITVVKAQEKIGYKPQDCLCYPPADLIINVVIGWGVELGRQANIIRDSHGCKWVQVVHKASEEHGMNKSYSGAISKNGKGYQTEVQLCQSADFVVAIGPKLADTILSSLPKSENDVFCFTPGVLSEFYDLKQPTQDGSMFTVVVFSSGDPGDFCLEGFDIAAKAVAELKDRTCKLLVVGVPEEKNKEVANNLHQFIPKDQLTVRDHFQRGQELKKCFCEAGIAIMPSRTGAFGLTAHEALSACLPVLVSDNSGFARALLEAQSNSPYVVESEDATVWAKAIKCARNKTRELRLKEIEFVRKRYAEKYSWEEQCGRLVQKMWKLVDEKNIQRLKLPTARHYPHQPLSRNYGSFGGEQWDYSSWRRQRRMSLNDAWPRLIAANISVKEGEPSYTELEELAQEIGDDWKPLGRRLEFEEAKLTGFHKENEKLSEKAYAMLRSWKNAKGRHASYQELYDALCHSLVRRADLASKFCCDER